MPQSALRQTVRERLASGRLFPAPSKVWAGKGAGHVCVICATVISSAEIALEHEVVAPATIWAHMPCYSIWREESKPDEPASRADEVSDLTNLRQIVRDRFAKGTLFVLPHDKSWTGRGVSDICAVCSTPIFAAESSQEVIGVRRAHAHVVCYRAWLVESTAVGQLEERYSAESHDDATGS